MLDAATFQTLLERTPPQGRTRLWVSPPVGTRLPGDGADDAVLSLHAGDAASWRKAGKAVRFGPDDPSPWPETFDEAWLVMPKARREFSWLLAQVVPLLKPGSRLICTGHKKSGVEGALKGLRAAGATVEKLDSARHCQVWSVVPETVRSEPAGFEYWPFVWQEREIRVATLPGVFAEGRLDDGTAMLLETLATQPLPPGRWLDFGCGAGVLSAALATCPGGEVEAVDVQWQAVTCTRRTLAENGLQGEVMASDGLDAVEGRYDAVISNPPFHAHVRQTTDVTERFIRAVRAHLRPGGRLRLVANAFLPYAQLLEQHVGPVQVLARDGRYKVYEATAS